MGKEFDCVLTRSASYYAVCCYITMAVLSSENPPLFDGIKYEKSRGIILFFPLSQGSIAEHHQPENKSKNRRRIRNKDERGRQDEK